MGNRNVAERRGKMSKQLIENIKIDVETWLTDNFEVVEELILDKFREFAKANNIEEFEADLFVEEMSTEIQTGLINLIETYEPFDREEG